MLDFKLLILYDVIYKTDFHIVVFPLVVTCQHCSVHDQVPMFLLYNKLKTSVPLLLFQSTYAKSLNQYYHKMQIIMARNLLTKAYLNYHRTNNSIN